MTIDIPPHRTDVLEEAGRHTGRPIPGQRPRQPKRPEEGGTPYPAWSGRHVVPPGPATPRDKPGAVGVREHVVGRSVPFRDAEDAVTGSLRYLTDLCLPGMLHGAVVRSTVPHGRIRRIDVAPALAMSGVVAVVTAKDVPFNMLGVIVMDWPVLASNVVRQVGDPIALVAAVTPAAATAGAHAVAVDVEPLPAVSSPEAALQPGAPALHEGGNVLAELSYVKGDVEAALSTADVVIERTVRTPCQEHACLEPGGGMATCENGRIIVWCGTQDPDFQRHQVARVLQVGHDEVRVISTPMGGAFGSKLDGALPAHLALLARVTGRPVKLVLSREEVMLVGAKRHPYVIHTRLGMNAQGQILAVDTDALVDTGPYGSHGPAVLKVSGEISTGAYRATAARFRGRLVYTNNANAGAFRGYGTPQVTFAIESAIDAAAALLGLDPVEIRRQNVLRPGDEHGLYGHRVSAGLRAEEVLRVAASHPWWLERDRWRDSSRPPQRRGTGLALAVKGVGLGSGRGDAATASLTILADGRVQIWAGPNHSGQSIQTAYAQIAAEELGRPLEDIDVFVGDSDLVPESGPCSASRSTYCGGSAVRLVCRELIERVQGPVPDDAGGWRDVASQLAAAGQATMKATFAAPDVQELGSFTGPLEKFSPHAVYSSSAQVARVEVNELTGEARVVSVACALDCGTAVNPAGVVGQARGGISQGLGYALMESYRLAESIPQTRSLETYLIPTAADAPETDIVLVEAPEGSGPFGAKGIAEVVLTPTAPAIIAAIRDATGVDITHLPGTPDSILWRKKDL